LRNMYPEALAEEAGFIYYVIGRRPPRPASRTHDRPREFTPRGRDIRQVTH
jgi:hypothetical protein